jgi:drug/metabolite transporter (DMT)-like permease
VVWGFADYAAGICARRVGAVRTAFAMQAIGLLSFAAALSLLGRWPTFEPGMVPFAIALGLLGVISVAALYRGLALGPVAVVAPVVASYVVITVILVVIFLGERLTTAQILAAAIVFVGVVLTSTDARELRVTLGRPVPGVRIGLIATLGFGLWSAVFAIATREYPWAAMIVLLRATSFVFIGSYIAARRMNLRVFRNRTTFALGALVGVGDTLANVLFARGIESGYASLAATGTGMYPIVPAVLGMIALGERLAPNQLVGIGLLILGLAALGAVS